jgi:hypothetical protein
VSWARAERAEHERVGLRPWLAPPAPAGRERPRQREPAQRRQRHRDTRLPVRAPRDRPRSRPTASPNPANASLAKSLPSGRAARPPMRGVSAFRRLAILEDAVDRGAEQLHTCLRPTFVLRSARNAKHRVQAVFQNVRWPLDCGHPPRRRRPTRLGPPARAVVDPMRALIGCELRLACPPGGYPVAAPSFTPYLASSAAMMRFTRVSSCPIVCACWAKKRTR